MRVYLPASRTVVPELEFLAEIGSTNTELARRASLKELPDFSVLATAHQTGGRGRLGRSWIAPESTAIAVSVYLRASAGIGWLPLLAGLAMTRAVRLIVPGKRVSLKWPNDVLVEGLKVSGLLGEAVPRGGAVMGAGLNLTMAETELPVPTATSLTLCGADPDDIVDRALAAYLGELSWLWREFESSSWDAGAGLRESVSAVCDTLGRTVRVELPGGSELHGTAESIDERGHLTVRTGSTVSTVAVGDVTHVRHQ